MWASIWMWEYSVPPPQRDILLEQGQVRIAHNSTNHQKHSEEIALGMAMGPISEKHRWWMCAIYLPIYLCELQLVNDNILPVWTACYWHKFNVMGCRCNGLCSSVVTCQDHTSSVQGHTSSVNDESCPDDLHHMHGLMWAWDYNAVMTRAICYSWQEAKILCNFIITFFLLRHRALIAFPISS